MGKKQDKRGGDMATDEQLAMRYSPSQMIPQPKSDNASDKSKKTVPALSAEGHVQVAMAMVGKASEMLTTSTQAGRIYHNLASAKEHFEKAGKEGDKYVKALSLIDPSGDVVKPKSCADYAKYCTIWMAEIEARQKPAVTPAEPAPEEHAQVAQAKTPSPDYRIAAWAIRTAKAERVYDVFAMENTKTEFKLADSMPYINRVFDGQVPEESSVSYTSFAYVMQWLGPRVGLEMFTKACQKAEAEGADVKSWYHFLDDVEAFHFVGSAKTTSGGYIQRVIQGWAGENWGEPVAAVSFDERKTALLEKINVLVPIVDEETKKALEALKGKVEPLNKDAEGAVATLLGFEKEYEPLFEKAKKGFIDSIDMKIDLIADWVGQSPANEAELQKVADDLFALGRRVEALKLESPIADFKKEHEEFIKLVAKAEELHGQVASPAEAPKPQYITQLESLAEFHRGKGNDVEKLKEVLVSLGVIDADWKLTKKGEGYADSIQAPEIAKKLSRGEIGSLGEEFLSRVAIDLLPKEMLTEPTTDGHHTRYRLAQEVKDAAGTKKKAKRLNKMVNHNRLFTEGKVEGAKGITALIETAKQFEAAKAPATTAQTSTTAGGTAATQTETPATGQPQGTQQVDVAATAQQAVMEFVRGNPNLQAKAAEIEASLDAEHIPETVPITIPMDDGSTIQTNMREHVLANLADAIANAPEDQRRQISFEGMQNTINQIKLDTLMNIGASEEIVIALNSLPDADKAKVFPVLFSWVGAIGKVEIETMLGGTNPNLSVDSEIERITREFAQVEIKAVRTTTDQIQ